MPVPPDIVSLPPLPVIVSSPLPPISESKLQPCEKLTKPKSGSHNDVELWAVETVFAYRLCAQKQDDLIDAVRVRQQALEERGK